MTRYSMNKRAHKSQNVAKATRPFQAKTAAIDVGTAAVLADGFRRRIQQARIDAQRVGSEIATFAFRHDLQSLTDKEGEYLRALQAVLIAANETMLTAYNDACAAYLDIIVDPTRFRETYETEIRDILAFPDQSLFPGLATVSETYPNLSKTIDIWTSGTDASPIKPTIEVEISEPVVPDTLMHSHDEPLDIPSNTMYSKNPHDDAIFDDTVTVSPAIAPADDMFEDQPTSEDDVTFEDAPVEETADETFEDAPSDEEFEDAPVEDAPSDDEFEDTPVEETVDETFEDAPSDDEFEDAGI